MGFHEPKITMSSVGWSGVRLAAIGLWSSANTFSGLMNHAQMHSANCQVWWRRNNGLGLFFMVRAP
jgi:hypothetical protein